MGHDLEHPGGTDEDPDWESLYRARGEEVVAHRPFFTGDIFTHTLVRGIDEPKTRTIALLQHPCALRTNGVDLVARLLVAELRKFKPPSARGVARPRWQDAVTRSSSYYCDREAAPGCFL